MKSCTFLTAFNGCLSFVIICKEKYSTILLKTVISILLTIQYLKIWYNSTFYWLLFRQVGFKNVIFYIFKSSHFSLKNLFLIIFKPKWRVGTYHWFQSGSQVESSWIAPAKSCRWLPTVIDVATKSWLGARCFLPRTYWRLFQKGLDTP